MNELSIIISIKNMEKQIEKTLDSIKNQTLKNIEIIFISDNSIHIKNNKIKLCNSIYQAIDKATGEYIFFMEEIYFIKKETCSTLYQQAKMNDLDVLYVPIFDQNIKGKKKFEFNNKPLITPFNYAQFCKKKYVTKLNLNNNLYYEINKNSKRTNFIKQEYCFRHELNQKTIKKYTKEFLNNFSNRSDEIFYILLNYLIEYPLNSKQNIYKIIRYNFKSTRLNKKNHETYSLILKNENIIDFLTEYQLKYLDYEISKNPLENQKLYKITVIIPIFNNEKLIHRTLMSIENQSFGIENIEVLMINDASTDNTKKIINEYANKYPNFKAIHIKNGSGSSGTPRNLGLKLSSSKYLLFLDHDDFLEINALEKLYNKIKKYNCDFVYGTYILMNSEESIKFVYPNAQHGFFKNIDDNNTSITTPPSIWTKLFKKEFLEKNNILFPTVLGEDAIFMAKSLKHANGVYYLWDEVICYYNLNENSYSTNLSYKYFLEGFASEEYLFNLFNKWDQIKYYKIRGQGILDFYINRILCSNLTDDELNSIFPEFKKFCNRLYELNIKPKVEKNNIAFNYAIKNDVKGFLKFKNYKPSKIKVFSNKLLNKINKHSFW